MADSIKHTALIWMFTGTFVFFAGWQFILGTAAEAKSSNSKPNIILIVTDDQTYESLAKMPYLSSRKDWIFFDNAYQNVSLCCSARATLLTGQYDTHTGVLDNKGRDSGVNLDDSQTLATWLDKKGYKTALMGKYLNGYGNHIKGVPAGWDKWFAFFGEAHYNGYTITINGNKKNFGNKNKDYSTDVLADEAVAFIKNAKKSPFFLYWAPKTPHAPYIPAKRHKGTYANAQLPHNPSVNEADVSDKPAYIRNLPRIDEQLRSSNRRAQWEMLLAVDEAIKRFEKVLAEEKIADNTVIIFIADNGHAFGEHRWVHKRCAYDACLHAALAIKYPGQAGRHINSIVSNIDIAPTITEIANARVPISMDGVSLVPLIKGTSGSWRDVMLSHWGGGGKVGPDNPPNYWTVRTEHYRYTEYTTGEKELYDYAADPYELENKTEDASYAAIEADLKTKLEQLKADALAPSKKASGNMKKAAQDDSDNSSAIDNE